MHKVPFWVWLVALWAALVLPELARMDVLSDNEGQRAAPPAEMLRTGDYVIPTLNGEIYLAKPPLLYWTIAGVYALSGGPSELGARMPSAVAMLLWMLAVYGLGRRWVGEFPARWGAVILLVAPYVLERARWAELDIPLSLMTLLALAALYAGWRSEGLAHRIGWALLAGLPLAAAILLKGPVPFLFLLGGWLGYLAASARFTQPCVRQMTWFALAALVVAFFFWGLDLVLLAVQRENFQPLVPFPVALVLLLAGWVYLLWGHARPQFFPALGLLVLTCLAGIALAAPWAAAVLQRLGWDFIAALLDNQVVERTYTASRINGGHPLFFIVALPVLLLPWGFLLPLVYGPRNLRALEGPARFCALSAAASVLIFSLIAGKEYEYILPAFPLLALPLGLVLERLRTGTPALPPLWARWRDYWLRGLIALGVLGAVGLPIYGLLEYREALAVAELGLCGGVAAALLWLAWRQPPARRFVCIALVLAPILLGWVISRSWRYNGERSMQAIALQSRALLDAGKTVESSKVYPAFTFYCGVPMAEVIDPAEVRARLLGDAPYYYLTREPFVEDMIAGHADEVKIIAGPYSSKDLVLLANKAALAAE